MTVDASVELDGEYRLLREEAGFVDRSARAKLDIGGADAAEFLQGQLSNEVEGLAPGSGCYTALLDRKGHLQADARVLRLDDGRFWLDCEAEGGPAMLRHLNTYKIGRDVTIADVGDAWAILEVIGPAADERVLGGPRGPEHSHRSLRLDDVECRAVGTQEGIDLVCAAEVGAALANALTRRGIPAVSEAAAEVVRVEAGRARFGRDMTTETMPQEAGINDRAVSFTKGCYIGQETVARLHYRGKPNRHMRGIRLDGPVADGDAVVAGEREVGHVGTAALSPALGPIALAILRREAEPGAAVAVGDAGIAGTVVELPF